MKKILLYSLLVVSAATAGAQTQTEQLMSLKTRLEANAQKLSNLKTELAAEKQLDDQLIAWTNGLITQSYQRGNSITAIKNALPGLETKTQFLWTMGNEVYIIGANLQVRNGSNLTTNTLGNVIVGHNTLRATGNSRLGSHNLIFGNGANYSSHYGVVGGLDNNLYAPFSAVVSGKGNEVSGGDPFQAVLTGLSNRTTAGASVIVTGKGNLVSSVRSVIGTGSYNKILFGYENVIATGENGYIEDGVRSFILTGLRNKLYKTQYSGIGTGIDNYLGSNWKFSSDN